MSRTLNRLTARQVETLGAGRHADGGGLYLDREEERSRWIFMWTRSGRRREMGLGPVGKGGISLAQARAKAAWARGIVADGGDPIAVRNAERAEPAPVLTFGAVADDYLKSLSPQWRNEKHRAQWRMTLREYCKSIRGTAVDQIDTAAVLKVLEPIWATKPETAARLRGRIERVLDAAKAKGLRSGENPARWRGHLDHLLPKRHKLSRGHHAAVPYRDVPALVARLAAREAVAALALEFLILTAARSGEVLGATWGEMDLQQKIWTVPAERMKAGREHRVPLSARAVTILETAKKLGEPGRHDAPVFTASRVSGLASMSLAMLLRRMKVAATVHGFRSSFRDWVAEATEFPRELAEAALAHVVGDATERAYWRGDVLERRRKVMEAWAEFVANVPKSTPETNDNLPQAAA